MKCTWIGCTAVAAHVKLDKDGAVWAQLCSAHNREFEGAKTAPAVLAAWVKAQGGAKAAAGRM